MAEKILYIKTIDDYYIESQIYKNKEVKGCPINMDGYQITTDEHTYRVLINNVQQDREYYGFLNNKDGGFFSEETNLNEFIGAELLKVEVSDTALNEPLLDAWGCCDETKMQFINFTTDKGVFQIILFNDCFENHKHEVLVLQDDDVVILSTEI